LLVELVEEERDGGGWEQRTDVNIPIGQVGPERARAEGEHDRVLLTGGHHIFNEPEYFLASSLTRVAGLDQSKDTLDLRC
jgi:hypothetical protein